MADFGDRLPKEKFSPRRCLLIFVFAACAPWALVWWLGWLTTLRVVGAGFILVWLVEYVRGLRRTEKQPRASGLHAHPADLEDRLPER